METPNLYNSLNIAEKIKYCAKQQNISIKEMLVNLKLGSNTMSNMRHGRMIASDSLAKIADYLAVPVDYLLGRGVFANWDRIMDNKKHIIGVLEDKSQYAKELDLNNQPEIVLMYFLSALFAKIDISDDNEEINLYPYVLPSQFDELLKPPPEEQEE